MQIENIYESLIPARGKQPPAFPERFNAWRLGLVLVRLIGLAGLQKYW